MSSPQTLLIQYRYDPLDRLVACTPANLPIHQRFYQKDRLATEIQGALAHSIFQQEDLLLAQQQRQGLTTDTILLATDQQRSVLHAQDKTQRQAMAYNPYGHRAPTNGLLSVLGFNGEKADPITGHYLLGNGYRAFNPILMRFNSPDNWSPFGRAGINPYTYCQADPVNRSDPSGHIVSLLIKKATHLISHSKAPYINRLVTGAIKASPPPLLATGATAASSNGRSSIVTDFLSLTKKSLFEHTGTPTASPSSGRQIIQQELNTLYSSEGISNAFTKRLKKVNENLISHGDNTLSLEHGQYYVNLAQQVESGTISNTTAHLESAKKWVETRGVPGKVGATFNLLAAAFSGVNDHRMRTLGASAIRSSQP